MFCELKKRPIEMGFFFSTHNLCFSRLIRKFFLFNFVPKVHESSGFMNFIHMNFTVYAKLSYNISVIYMLSISIKTLFR